MGIGILKSLLLVAAASITTVGSVNAVSVVLDSGGCGSCNVLFTNGQIGDPVFGTTGAGQTIQYSSPSGTLATAASGQANIQSANGGLFSEITWGSLSTPYTLEFFNLNVGDTVQGSPASGTVNVTVFTNLLPGGQLFTLGVRENGANQIKILAGANEGIIGVLLNGLTNGLGIQSFIQDRITGVFDPNAQAPGETPIPGTAVLLGSVLAGVFGFGAIRRRRQSNP